MRRGSGRYIPYTGAGPAIVAPLVAHVDVPEFLSHWGADANAMTQAVRRIGELEQREGPHDRRRTARAKATRGALQRAMNSATCAISRSG